MRGKLQRGEGPFWGRAKRAAKAVYSLHVPVNGVTRRPFQLAYRFHVLARESWIWTKRFFWYEPLFRGQCESVGSGFQMEELPWITGAGRIVIGNSVQLSGKSSFTFYHPVFGPPELVIGDGTFIGHGCGFNIGRSVRIGRYCLFATSVQIFDNDGHPLDAASRRTSMLTPPEAIKPVVIGDEVWVGNGSLILKGVTIGDRAVVGARSVVTKDVPPDTVVAGNPARVVKVLDRPAAPPGGGGW
ncbi:DapH/DapD/GlmU-related protein [Frigoriglobus tundricola]|uniref:DapH/DapD/GlmU-related protein n=1 Tax=Frigoriglobus tundricola TaxID=2774151 RepID=UPI0028F45EF1|nr:DapH/DapD/GlmU-related protein [Frigoriglobus tundricola]